MIMDISIKNPPVSSIFHGPSSCKTPGELQRMLPSYPSHIRNAARGAVRRLLGEFNWICYGLGKRF